MRLKTLGVILAAQFAIGAVLVAVYFAVLAVLAAFGLHPPSFVNGIAGIVSGCVALTLVPLRLELTEHP